jgi:hypothetical protein
MKPLLKLAAAALVARIAAPAQADPRQNPTSDYSAERVESDEEGNFEIRRVWYTKEKTRQDVNLGGARFSWIVDRSAGTFTSVHWTRRLCGKQPLSGGELINPIASGSWEIAKVGEETMGGVLTGKWSVSGKSPNGGGFSGFVWTTKENIQVRIVGVFEFELTDKRKLKSKSTLELRTLKIGPVDPKVFEVPFECEKR